MVDPQGQAIKWIKNMEKSKVSTITLESHNKSKSACVTQSLKVIDLQQPDFLRTLENAVQFGSPVLLQNVGEELDPSLGPILNKSLIKKGTIYYLWQSRHTFFFTG